MFRKSYIRLYSSLFFFFCVYLLFLNLLLKLQKNTLNVLTNEITLLTDLYYPNNVCNLNIKILKLICLDFKDRISLKL